jgi:hypothetical protein
MLLSSKGVMMPLRSRHPPQLAKANFVHAVCSLRASSRFLPKSRSKPQGHMFVVQQKSAKAVQVCSPRMQQDVCCPGNGKQCQRNARNPPPQITDANVWNDTIGDPAKLLAAVTPIRMIRT